MSGKSVFVVDIQLALYERQHIVYVLVLESVVSFVDPLERDLLLGIRDFDQIEQFDVADVLAVSIV